jgi:hypothetical protein
MDEGWQTTDAKWWQKLTLPLARWAKKPDPLQKIMFHNDWRRNEFKSTLKR